jgi:hypothetical protein
MGQRITKRTVDALEAREKEFTVWDAAVTGFGLRVRPSGAMSYVVVYRAGPGRGAPVRRFTIASVWGQWRTAAIPRDRKPPSARHRPSPNSQIDS